MPEEKAWKPDNDAAIEEILRLALTDAGTIRPDDLPSHVRKHIKDYAAGTTDLDAYIKTVMAKIKKDEG